MNKFVALLVASVMAFGATSQAYAWGNGDDNASSIEKTDARKMNKVLKGVVLQVSDAKIDSSKKAESAGVLGGGAAGAAIGANQHGLVGMVVGGAVGAIGGAIAGAFVGGQDAQDLIIQLDNGEVINITQAIDDKIGKFADNDPVLIVYKGDSGRVIRNKMATAAAPAAVAATPAAPTTPAAQ